VNGPAGEVRRIPAVAAADVPHGGRCRLERGKAYPCEDLDGSGGISAGPSTVLGYTRKGPPLRIQTDGGVMTEAGYVQLRGGRLVQ
jgi:hypothetical protein